jgi:prephenate dehydratase
MPIIDTPWKYAFFVDFIFNDYSLYSSAMEEIKDKVVTLKILGEYTKSKR